MNSKNYILQICQSAHQASKEIASASLEIKNNVLTPNNQRKDEE